MAITFQDYYATLGVSRTAPAAEIKQAFRKLARVHHPDVAKNKIAGEAKFKEINEAYEVLGDPEKRKQYDELAETHRTGRPDPGTGGDPRPRGRQAAPRGADGFEFDGTGFSDFFESMFGGTGGGRGGPEADFASPGGDVEADLLVTLEEALHGARRPISLRRPGERGGPERTDSYHVRIPPGVREGQRIRLAGQGRSGTAGAAHGDLYLRVRLALHPDFRVLGGDGPEGGSGTDLDCDLDLAPWEAVLGTQARIPTLDGPTSLRVPPGTATGSRLRLRGLGLPREGGGGGRGDLYATVRVQTPRAVSAEERVLWEQLKQLAERADATATTGSSS